MSFRSPSTGRRRLPFPRPARAPRLLLAAIAVGLAVAAGIVLNGMISNPPNATGTPTVTGTPTATAAARASSRFPDASNTGVPAGTALTASGDLTITSPGLVENKDVKGTVTINTSNVTFRASRVTGAGFGMIRVQNGLTGVRIEDVTVDGLGNSGVAGSNGIWGPATVLRADISGVENGFVPSSGSLLQDSWIHGLAAPGSPHIDGVQIDGGQSNVKILHNTIDMREWNQTSTVMIDNYSGAISNIQVAGNRLLGAGYTVYSDGSFNSNPISGVSFTKNHLGKGTWGYAMIRGRAGTPAWSGNVRDDTGAAVAG
jgi:hypothetical protein